MDPYEKMLIQANMDIAVHPMIVSKQAVGWVCEDYLFTNKGYECLHKTPQKIFTL